MRSLRRRLSVVLALLALVTAAARPASAVDGIVVSLDFQTDPELAACPDAADFRAAIRAHLRWNPFREGAPRQVMVRIRARDGRVEGRVEWRDATHQSEGERTFSSRTDTCAQLCRAIALATAIQIQVFASIDVGGDVAPEKTAAPPGDAPPSFPVIVVAPPVVRPPAPPRVGIEATVGLIQDAGNGPLFAVPRLVLILGRPSDWSLRFVASGLGPSAEVSQTEGTAQIDRLVATVELTRFFRAERRVQPVIAFGAGAQTVGIHGISAMPALASAHDGRVFSAALAVSGGLALALTPRLSVVVESGLLLFRPSVTVRIGASPSAAYLDGLAILSSGGLLARF
jgi:hypothetical protein